MLLLMISPVLFSSQARSAQNPHSICHTIQYSIISKLTQVISHVLSSSQARSAHSTIQKVL